jgi:hypothetical protein
MVLAKGPPHPVDLGQGHPHGLGLLAPIINADTFQLLERAHAPRHWPPSPPSPAAKMLLQPGAAPR